MSEPQNAEVLRLLSQMIREMGEFRQEMNVRFDKVDSRIRNVEYRLKYLANDNLELHGELEQVDDRLNKLEDAAA